jgi:hypothetical protein
MEAAIVGIQVRQRIAEMAILDQFEFETFRLQIVFLPFWSIPSAN